MVDPVRRKILKAGAAATAVAAAGRVMARQPAPGGASGSFYTKGQVRIRYEESGSGFPLLLIAGGGCELDDRRLEQPLRCDRGVPGRVPLHRVRSAQCHRRAILRSHWRSIGRGMHTPMIISA